MRDVDRHQWKNHVNPMRYALLHLREIVSDPTNVCKEGACTPCSHVILVSMERVLGNRLNNASVESVSHQWSRCYQTKHQKLLHSCICGPLTHYCNGMLQSKLQEHPLRNSSKNYRCHYRILIVAWRTRARLFLWSRASIARDRRRDRLCQRARAHCMDRPRTPSA